LYLRIAAGLLVLSLAGCVSFQEGYTTRYGLTNPDYPPIPPTPTDETYTPGSVGQQYIEEYDKKYHEKEVLISPAPDSVEEQEQVAQ